MPPEDEREETPFGRYYESDEWDASSATLQYDEHSEEFYLHVTVKQSNSDDEERQEATSRGEGAENGVVLGVDLNVTGAFAVTSTGKFIGSADDLTHKRNEFEKRRGCLQQTGTRSAHLTIQSIGSKFSDWSLDWLSISPEVRDVEREWRFQRLRVIAAERESTDKPRPLRSGLLTVALPLESKRRSIHRGYDNTGRYEKVHSSMRQHFVWVCKTRDALPANAPAAD